jgi:type VI secretion system protein ImpL
MMNFFRRFFRNPWVRSFCGVLFLSLMVWFFGPLLGLGQMHPFDSDIVRMITIAVFLVLWLVLNLLRELRHSKKDKELVEGVAAAAPDPTATASAEEMALLSDRLKQALTDLKKTKLGGGRGKFLYQLPWYMFIGPPGAGKTTALVNSGLNFPLADTHGPQALHGVGGTRNCDWWFTDQAVLIDTAGRYTTQDSQSAVDAASWLGFLKLLKHHRRRQPLNGVIVAISLSDLCELGEADRLAHAKAIRKRLRELHDELGVRIPVYVLFTKADLIAGFVDFFDSLGKEERDQVWGMTFALDDGKNEDGAIAQFAPEFDLLLARLNDRMLERVHQEPDVQRRRLIYGFPQQIASLRDVATEFLTEIFRPSRLEARPLLRGCYFTSGTQNGTPIDRLLGAMAGQFGLQRASVTAFSGTGRSYFLTRAIRDVCFGEAGLVSLDPKVEARARWTYRGAYIGCAAVLLLLTGVWTMSYLSNSAMIAQVHDEAAHYEAQYKEIQARGPNDTDIGAVLPALASLRTIRGGYDDKEASIPMSETFGLYQGQKLTSAAIDAYYRGLTALLTPRLLARLEAQMRAHMDKPDFLYEALKVYLILGRQGPLNRDIVMNWMQADFGAALPGDDNQSTRDQLLAHIDALMERPLSDAIPLDGPLVEQVRGILTREPEAEYSYNRIMRSPRIRSMPEWTIAENGGPGAGRVFQLRSGKPLQSGVPGIFTWSGYHETFLPILPSVTQDISEDRWVLGKADPGVTGAIAEVTKLRRDVLGLYLDDYVRQWDGLLADVTIKPFGNLQQGLDELNLLAAPDSPLRDLLQGIDTQTQLSKKSAVDDAAAKSEAKLAKAGSQVAGFASVTARAGLTNEQNALASILGESFGAGGAGGAPVDPASRVDQHFKTIHDFVAGTGAGVPAPMEAAISKIQSLYQNFNQVANSTNQGQALLGVVGGSAASAAGGGGGSAASQLDQLSKDLPKPIATMLQTVSQSSSSVTASGATAELSDAWRSKVLPLCKLAFNRYPFVASSSSDVPLEDFKRLLGPNGLMDQFFNDNLKPLVDTSTTPWHWQAADNTKLNLSPTTLVEFESAADIRDALFSSGTDMQVRFQLVPVSLDTGIGQITIDVAGQTLTYNNGPTESTQLQWPGQNGRTLVRVTMTPAGGGRETVVDKDGPWALLRLLDAEKLTPTGEPDKFHVVFTSPAGNATFDLNASSVRNPFSMNALRSFRCPEKL